MRDQGNYPKPQKVIVRAIPKIAYSVEETAEAIGIGRTMVFYLLRDGRLKSMKVGRRTLIAVSEVEAFIARNGKEVA